MRRCSRAMVASVSSVSAVSGERGRSASQGGPGAAIGPIVGIVMAIMMPVFYGCMGFVMGALGSFIYNLMAGWVGGIEVELQIEPVPHLIPAPAAAPQP